MDSWYTSKKERSFYGLYFMGQNAVYTFTYMFLATYLLLCGLDAVASILWDTAYTLCDVPVFGLVTTMTDIQDERTSLMTTGRIWANIGVLVAMMIGYLLPSEAIGLSFSNSALIVCAIALGTMFWLCFRAKEHVQSEERTAKAFLWIARQLAAAGEKPCP